MADKPTIVAGESYTLETTFIPPDAEASLNAKIDARLKQELDDAVFLHRRGRTEFSTQRACIEAALKDWLSKYGKPQAA